MPDSQVQPIRRQRIRSGTHTKKEQKMQNVTPGAPGEKKPFNYLRFALWFTALYVIALMLFGFNKKEQTVLPQEVAPMEKLDIPRELIPFEAVSLEGHFNAIGLRIDDARLKNYLETMKTDAQHVKMLGFDEKTGGDYVEVGFLARPREAGSLPGLDTKWKVVGKSPDKLVLEWKNPYGAIFTRTLSLDDKYMVTVVDKVENKGKVVLSFYPYARVVREVVAAAKGTQPLVFTGYMAGRLEELSTRDIAKKKTETFTSTGGWFGFSDNYFMTAIVLPGADSSTVRVVDPAALDPVLAGEKRIQADYVGGIRFVAPGESLELASRIYLGAKESAALAEYGQKYSIPRFDLAIDYGFFYIIAKPFTIMLRWLYSLVGNFGIAIIIFTIIIRFLMWPLTQKSIDAAERMRKLQPEMKRIQTLYANDKARMNMEMAMLYKREKMNPAAGCLPLLLQLPVFIALYKALIVSIEMRHAPFMLWITNLSAPDPTTIFNLFGLLPYQPWTWLPHLGILPLFMGWTMWYQMRLQPTSVNTDQAKIMRWMPVLFTLMFAGLPSGLVLYWTINNLLSIAQHSFTRKQA